MSSLAWRRATREDIPALADFLRAREELCAGFSGRLIRDGRFHLPSPLRGAVWIAPTQGEGPGGAGSGGGAGGGPALRGAPLRGALLCHPSRLAFPILPVESAAEALRCDADLALVAGSWRPASAIGLAENLDRYSTAFGLKPSLSVSYRLMARRFPRAAEGEAEAPPPGILIRQAAHDDLDALYPLQEAYEREEVLTPLHEFNPLVCKRALAKALESQRIFLAFYRGAAIGKAGTNARGFRVDQVGGVFTVPAMRGHGIGRALMLALLREVEGRGRRVALFVKPTNAPAMALYRALGFEEIGEYRADYFPE